MFSSYFLIYVHGLFCCRLGKGNEIKWPLNNIEKAKLYFNNLLTDSSEENKLLYQLIENLSDKNLVPGELIKNNKNILEFIKENFGNNYYIFSYDFREALTLIIERLANTVETLDIKDKKIVFLSHSAGGIISYMYINNPKYIINDNYEESNHSKITKYITIGAPIQGSVKALSAIMGLCQLSVLRPNDLKKIFNSGFFKSIYQLLPNNINNLFFYKKSKKLLPQSEIIKLLLNNGFDEQILELAIDFRKEFNNLPHNDNIDYTFIVGSYNKEIMCTGFSVDDDTNSVECIYDNGAGDGTVLFNEAILDSSKNAKIRYVIGKHSYLTEIDDVLNILTNELSDSLPLYTRNIILSDIIKVPSKESNKLEFYLYILKDDNKLFIKDMKFKSAVFTQKTYSQDITKLLKYNKENNSFYFKTICCHGLLKLRDINITYYNQEMKDTKNQSFKSLYIELEEPHLNYLF